MRQVRRLAREILAQRVISPRIFLMSVKEVERADRSYTQVLMHSANAAERGGQGRIILCAFSCATYVSFSIFYKCIRHVCPRRTASLVSITDSSSLIWRKLLWYARVHSERLLRSDFATRSAMLIRNLTPHPSKHEKALNVNVLI